jgi:AcrR family transcriptional regulator
MVGRRVEARRNDVLVLEAACQVFAESGVEAPVALVAQRAGVGMGSLYRRYPTKDALLRDVCVVGLEVAVEMVEKVSVEGDWERVLAAAAQAKVGRFVGLAAKSADGEVRKARERLDEAVGQALGRARFAGLRDDVTGADLLRVVEMLSAVEPVHLERCLALVVDGLRR